MSRDLWNPKQNVGGHSWGWNLHVVVAEIQAIRARQHAAGIHDPECPRDLSLKARDRYKMQVTILKPCDCWLVTEWADD